jgi:hypothetical protein
MLYVGLDRWDRGLGYRDLVIGIPLLLIASCLCYYSFGLIDTYQQKKHKDGS